MLQWSSLPPLDLSPRPYRHTGRPGACYTERQRSGLPAQSTSVSPSFAGAPCPKAKCGMVEDDNTDGPFTIRAANPRLNPPEVIEVCRSKSAMQTRAGDLYRAGYEVEVVKPRPRKGS